jgi:hypothetical protein
MLEQTFVSADISDRGRLHVHDVSHDYDHDHRRTPDCFGLVDSGAIAIRPAGPAG